MCIKDSSLRKMPFSHAKYGFVDFCDMIPADNFVSSLLTYELGFKIEPEKMSIPLRMYCGLLRYDCLLLETYSILKYMQNRFILSIDVSCTTYGIQSSHVTMT